MSETISSTYTALNHGDVYVWKTPSRSSHGERSG